MRTLVTRVRASEGERYAPDAFADMIGKTVPVRAGMTDVTGTVVAVDIIEDGHVLVLTIEVPANQPTERGKG